MRRLTIEQVMWIRACADKRSSTPSRREVAATCGISIAAVIQVEQYRTYRDILPVQPEPPPGSAATSA